MRLPKVLTVLRHGPFARYMAGEFTSMIGTWMQIFAQGWVVTSLTKDAAVLGQLNFVGGLPMLVFTLLGGRVADRYDKRRILLAVLLVQITISLILCFLIAEKRILIWHLFVAAVVIGFAGAFEVPAVAAIVPELVPREEIANAVAIDRSTFHATRLIGPSLGGWIAGAFGIAYTYFLNAFSFCALALALFTLPRRVAGASAGESRDSGGWSEIKAGLAYVRSDGPTRTMLGLMMAMTAFVTPFLMITMPFYARVTLGLDEKHVGGLMAVSGIGSLVGSLGLLSIPKGRRSLALKFAAGCIALAVAGMAAAHQMSQATVPLILLTFGLSVTFGTANIVIQERAPEGMRGRVSSVAAMSFFGIVPFSGLVITEVIDRVGMRAALLVGGAGYLILALLLLAGKERLASAPAEV